MDGIILINKPKGFTSHDVVYKVKKIFNKKVGHTGTLDPNATGVLPLLIGKGTLCSKYLINHDKKYRVTLELGTKTTTGDSEGKIIEQKQVSKDVFNEKNLTEVFELCVGKQQQIPPIYSAIKVNGKKLYEYARKGQEVKIEPREITIYDLKLLKIIPKKNQIEFEVSCSKGTYIRSLCDTIAEKLLTIGYMKELERIQVGKFKLDNTLTIKELENYFEENRLDEINKNTFITIEELFNRKLKIELSSKKLNLFLNGVMLNEDYPNGLCRVYSDGNFIGIGVVENRKLKRDIII